MDLLAREDTLEKCKSVNNKCSGNGQCVNSPRGISQGFADFVCKCNKGFKGADCSTYEGSLYIYSFAVFINTIVCRIIESQLPSLTNPGGGYSHFKTYGDVP